MNGQQSKNGEKSLETRSHLNDLSEPCQVLEGQLRECFGRVVYSHKTHEKCADILLKRLSRMKSCVIVLSAITTVGCISQLFSLERIGAIIASFISAILLGFTLYTKDYNLAELAQKHKQAANNIWLIREKYQSLITDLIIGEKPIETIQHERDILMEDLHLAYSSAPSTTSKAYKKAQQALKYNEDMTFSDEEIDVFLPKELRRNQTAVSQSNDQYS